MTETELEILRKYLTEQRRHYIALAKSCEMMLLAIAPAAKKIYNTGNGGNETIAAPMERQEQR